MIAFESDFLSWLHSALPGDEAVAEMAMVSEREDGEDYGILTFVGGYEGEIPEPVLAAVEKYEGSTPAVLELVHSIRKGVIA